MSLGMRHDGPLADNDCDPGSYLMSPTLGSGKITWSSCSRQYLMLFLQSPQSHCLMDRSTPGHQLDHSSDGLLPGERFSASQQCMLKYGRGSKHSPVQPIGDVCRDLHCTKDSYIWTSHPALEGTQCGSKKWCRSGQCVRRGTTAVGESMKGGWNEWSSFSECASGCLTDDNNNLNSGSTGVMVASRLCNNRRSDNGANACVGSDKKYMTCQPNQCERIQKTSIHSFADEVCLRAKEVDSELIGTGIQKISASPEEACTVWCHKKTGGTKSKGWTFPDGTNCQMHRDNKPFYCIAGVCQEFKCSSSADEIFIIPSEMCSSTMFYSRDKRREVAVGIWIPISDCYSNCISPGAGLRLVEKRPCRYCNTTTSIQLCQPAAKKCSSVKSPVDEASAVCTRFSKKVRRLSGLGMQLSPSSDDPDRPCRLACQDEVVPHRFYLVNGEDGWYPFGTDCSRGDPARKAYCVSGKCLEFGSDNTPLHDMLSNFIGFHRHKRELGILFETSIHKSFPRQDHKVKKSYVDFKEPILVTDQELNVKNYVY